MAKRTIRRRLRKNRTIRKVMRGCNGRRGRGKVGGATEAVQYSGSGSGANGPLVVLQAGTQQAIADAKAQTPPAIPPQVTSNQMAGSVSSSSSTTPVVEPFSGGNFSSPYSTYNSQVGGSHHRGRSKTRHHKRKLRYKKSVARKSRRS